MVPTSTNEGRGPRGQKRRIGGYWLQQQQQSGVGLVLYFSIPIFLSPGGGIGAPTNMEEEEEQQQPPTVRETAAGDLSFDKLVNNDGSAINHFQKF